VHCWTSSSKGCFLNCPICCITLMANLIFIEIVDVLQFKIKIFFVMWLWSLWCVKPSTFITKNIFRLSYFWFFSHAFDGPHSHNNNCSSKLGSHWLQIRSRNARYSFLIKYLITVCVLCASLTFVWAHPFQESLFVGTHLFQERHEWHEPFIVFWFAKLFH